MIRASVGQIVSGMRRRRGAYLSLVLEVALGCTVVAYILALGDGLRNVSYESIGFDDLRTFVVEFEEAPRGSHAQRRARELAAVRALPGVQAAAWIELPPLSRCELPESVMTPSGERLIWTLRGDDQILNALGATVALGRAPTANDARASGPQPALVTPGLAAKLGAAPLGQLLSSPGLGTLSVVGVIDQHIRLGTFYARQSELAIIPSLPLEARRTTYLVRTTAAAADHFASRARPALAAGASWVDVERVSETRQWYVRNVHGADTIILITVFGMLMVVLVGSMGMASSLIVERARQIGIRRALGARKADIAAYFMLENLFATGLGLVIGAGLCAMLDYLLAPIKGALVIDWFKYLEVAGALFLVSGQLAVFLPARRAACIAPSVASRPA